MHVTGEDVPDLLEAIALPGVGPTFRVGNQVRAMSLIEQVVDCLGRDETMASLISAAGAAWNLLALLAERDSRTFSVTMNPYARLRSSSARTCSMLLRSRTWPPRRA